MSWPFAAADSPAHWHRTRLRSFLTRRKRYGKPGLPLLSVNLPVGVVKRLDGDGRPAPSLDLSGYQEVRPGDVVMNQLGKPHGAIGVSPHHGITSPAYFVAEVGTVAEPRYVHHLLRTQLFIHEYQRRGKNLPPNQFDISWDQFRDIDISLPPLGEQRAIADYLDTETARIDALITKKRRLITLLEEQRASVTLAGVSGTHTEFGFETCSSALAWTSERATHFHEVLLRLVADQGTGHTPSRDHPEWWNIEECVVPWITTGEVRQMRSDRIEYITSTREMISEAGIENSSATPHPPGTVVLCRTASAGYSAIMGTEMATSQDFATWTCGALLSPRYLLLCLRAMRSDLLGRLATGSTHKTIYMPDIQALRIPLPTLSDQERIVDWVWSKLRRLDQTGKALSAQLDLLVEHRQALITAAVTGELRVPGVAV